MPTPTAHRLKGLDSIRFLAALVVVHNHLGNPRWLAFVDYPWAHFLNSFGGALFFAPSAVIIFFVVSGLCIHYPYASGKTLHPFEFIIRRYIRVGIPLVILTPVALWLGVDFKLFDNNILWSLFAEIIYYSLYPLLMVVQRKVGWNILIGSAFAISFLLFASIPEAPIYPVFGIKLNWLAGLPCWLLGARLAESLAKGAKPRGNIFFWRGFAAAGMSATLVLHFHSHLKNPFALNLYAILVYFWLLQEVLYFLSHAPWAPLERWGKWSYSLYLTHLPVITFLATRFAGVGVNLRWALTGVSCLIVARIFYELIEKPSHRLAKSSLFRRVILTR